MSNDAYELGYGFIIFFIKIESMLGMMDRSKSGYFSVMKEGYEVLWIHNIDAICTRCVVDEQIQITLTRLYTERIICDINWN